MHSDSVYAVEYGDTDGRPIVRRILDPAFGLFVWAAHLLVIYVAQALACVFAIPSRSAQTGTAVLVGLAAATLLAAAIVAAHGVRRHRQQAETDDQRFLFKLAVGQDAIAAVAILWQLIPIFMVPICR